MSASVPTSLLDVLISNCLLTHCVVFTRFHYSKGPKKSINNAINNEPYMHGVGYK